MLLIQSLCVFGLVIRLGQSSIVPVGPVGTVDVHRMDVCKFQNSLKENPSLRLSLSAQDRALTGEIYTPFDFDDSITFKVALHKWSSNQWKANAMQKSGKLCEYLNKVLPKAWQDFLSSLEPKVKTKCAIAKGNYTIKDLKVPTKHLELPLILYGKLKVEFRVFKGKQNVMCVEAEIDSKSPKLLG